MAKRTEAKLKPAPFKSDFLLLDVKAGRAKLANQIAAGKKFRALIEVEINDQWGSDDGTSIEFGCDVKSVKLVGAA